MKFGKKVNILVLIMFVLSMLLSFAACSNAPATAPAPEKAAEEAAPEKTDTVSAPASTEKIRIMCYGDSNTWGWIPVKNGFPSTRFAPDVRWTGVLQSELGDKYQVVEQGLNGRTAGVDDYANGLAPSLTKELNLNGRPPFMQILKSQLPLEVVVIMLGTNDVKPYLKQTPEQVAASVKKLVTMVQESVNKETEWDDYKVPQVLLVAPAPVTEGDSPSMNEMFKGGDKTSAQLGKLYAEVAKETGVEFFDVASVLPVADGSDGVHLSPEGHGKLGKAMAEKIKAMTK